MGELCESRFVGVSIHDFTCVTHQQKLEFRFWRFAIALCSGGVLFSLINIWETDLPQFLCSVLVKALK